MARTKAPYIVVAGNIGCGKSTLVQVLCEHYGVEPIYEPNESNPFLADFYGDMRRYAFPSQMWFLSQKFRMHLALDRKAKACIQDRSVWEDAEIFAHGLFKGRKMTPREWQLYSSFYRGVTEAIRPPDVLFYLHTPVKEIRRRIRQRGRPEEQSISYHYLRRLNERYDSWVKAWDLCPVHRIDTTKLHYLDDLFDRQFMLRRVARYLE
ncbi:MAG: deoxynucleoside kinase [Myxococcales bacterium]|nr:deoxynucleoside kinase [Myxococcales bacterium]